MGMIFVSYRREDAAGEARALFSSLADQLGAGSVFMDVDNIALGRDFRAALHERLNDCDVLLALIGKNWLDSKNRQGKPRLEDSNDFVRLEILAALKRNIPVTPVLLQDAEMPSADQLPEELREFAYRNAFELSHARWESDVREMVRRLGLVRQAPAALPAVASVPATRPAAMPVAHPAAAADAPRPATAPERSHGSSANPSNATPTRFPLAAVAVAVAVVVGGGAWLLSTKTSDQPGPTAQQRSPMPVDTPADPPTSQPTNQPNTQTTALDKPTPSAGMTANTAVNNAVNNATNTMANTAQNIETAPSSDADFQHMFSAGFVYCDAKLLAAHWKIDIGEAKSRIGRLVRVGQKPLVGTRLAQAYELAGSGRGARCDFSDSGYSFADAKKLAKVWGVSVAEARATVERKLNWGDDNMIRQALQGRG